jgi:uncharacterized 2Fe-2S/4Fe-4S cluster protein (DUF4445 family)
MVIKLTTGKNIPVGKNQSILSALKKNGIYLVSPCGGKGTCGKCRIKIIEGRYKTEITGKFSQSDRDKNIVIACQTYPEEDLTVEILEESKLVVGDKIALSKADYLTKLFKELDGKISPLANPDIGSKQKYGIAVDIGTTTIIVYVVNISDGSFVDVGMTYNSQIRYGDDVITRIIYATENNGLKELRDTVVDDINDLINTIVERHKIDKDAIGSGILSGNTTMAHLFWGLDTRSIREEPYVPAMSFFPLWKASDANININSNALVYTMPCIASYVGGDIVSGILASKMNRSPDVSLFMDIGTNGEIAIGSNEWLVTAACSAGPCFEGSGIKNGMRATEGAIEAVKINPKTFDVKLNVIGNAVPAGICGSGMIDAISEMFLAGIIDQKGKFVRSLKTNMIRDGEDGPEIVLHKNKKDIVLTEVDIENILRAKAAMYAGIAMLVQEVGFSIDKLKHVYVAGGFGNFLNIEKAVILGMLPDLPKERFIFLGNTSIAGAYLCLLSEKLRKEAEDIARKMTYIELSTSKSFMDEYMAALFLPHTDMKLFPTVAGLLKK